MGKHRKDDTGPVPEIRIGRTPEDQPDPTPEPEERSSAYFAGSLADLVEEADVPVDPETGEPTAPSNPDLFGHDPFYDRDERPRFAAWALALVLVIVLVVVGGISFMFGKGEIDGSPISSKDGIVTTTATITKQAPPVPGTTVRVTVKSQPKPGPTITVTSSPSPAPTIFRTGLPQLLPGPTIFRTQAAPTVTRTIRVPGPTKTVTEEEARCFRVRQGVIVAEIDCP